MTGFIMIFSQVGLYCHELGVQVINTVTFYCYYVVFTNEIC